MTAAEGKREENVSSNDQRCNVPQVKVNAKRPLVALFHCNGLFKATPNPYNAQDSWARVNCVSFWGAEAFLCEEKDVQCFA